MARLPQVNGKQLIRVLKKRHWYVDRQEGSHVVMKHPDRALPVTVLAGNKQLKKGTLHAILKFVGLTGDELREML